MPFVDRNFPQLSQLVVRDPFKEDAQCIDVINVENESNSDDLVVNMGTVVYRPKGDPTTTWLPVEDNTVIIDFSAIDSSGATADVTANEFAVIFGDNYDFNPSFSIGTESTLGCLAYVRGPCQLKDRLVRAYLDDQTLTAGEVNQILGLLAEQGILTNETVGSLG